VSTFRVALLQMTSCGPDPEANLKKGEEYVRRAKAQGADLALFPEMWNIGYEPYPGAPEDFHEVGNETPVQRRFREEWQRQAVDPESPFVRHFRELARELELAVALTYLEEWPGAPRNAVSVIDRRGEIAFTYAKVHTCAFALEAALTPGEDFPVCELDTRHGPVKVGAMICYDREFPESARILMLRGAEVILVPNACELEENRLAQFRARAYENMVGVAMTNYAAPQQNGHSVAFDGMAFDAGGRSRDMLLVEAGEGEGIYLADFDLRALREYREREAWGNAFRRPHRYGLLTATDIGPPFVRKDAAGKPYDPER
jgi:N-carbamoylputrescine amidase